MDSSLIQSRISESVTGTTSRIITSLLAGLPQLKSSTALDFIVTDDTSGTSVIPRIPFFEGKNSVELHFQEYQPGDLPPDWIPPSSSHGLAIWVSTPRIFCTKRYL